MEVRQRRRRLALLSAAYTAAVLVALAALAILTARRGGRWDLTESKRHSLQPQTEAVLRSLPEGSEPVDLVIVTSGLIAGSARDAENQFRPLLGAFQASSPNVRASVVLLEREPALQEALAIDRLPVAVLSWKPPAVAGEPPPERRERRTLVVTEAGIRQALRELVDDEKRVAYFLVGHDELRLGEQGGAGASLMARTLQSLNFETRELAMAGTADIPEDADLVVLAGPQSDLLKEEGAAIDRHRLRGGRFLVLDGPTREPGTLQILHLWLAAHWNIVPLEGLVADFEVPLGADARILLVQPDPEEHGIVSGLRRAVQLPVTRAIRLADQALQGVDAVPFLRSGERSWLETSLADPAPRYDEGVDLRGPHALAAAATWRESPTAPEARIVVLGSRMAFADQHLGNVGNMALLRNAADWATGREDDIAARLGAGADSDGAVVVADRQGRLILATMLVLPAVVALTGVAAWWRRRRL